MKRNQLSDDDNDNGDYINAKCVHIRIRVICHIENVPNKS